MSLGTNANQGVLNNARAEELSHMCISPSKKAYWFASHPPLENRINAIDSTFIKRFEARERKGEREEKKVLKKKSKYKQLVICIAQTYL